MNDAIKVLEEAHNSAMRGDQNAYAMWRHAAPHLLRLVRAMEAENKHLRVCVGGCDGDGGCTHLANEVHQARAALADAVGATP